MEDVSDQKGFSFPDVLIGVLILSLGILSASGMQVRAVRDTALADSLANAAIVARSTMDELGVAPYAHCVDKNLLITVGKVAYQVKIEVGERSGLKVKDVFLTVSWKEKHVQKYRLTKVDEK